MEKTTQLYEGKAKKVYETDDERCYIFSYKMSIEIIAEESGDSKSQVQRYIRLNELEPELQELVDDGKIGMTPAVEIVSQTR